MIAAGVPLHIDSTHRGVYFNLTPLLAFQEKFLPILGIYYTQRLLFGWLRILKSSGVDLEQCGKEEMELLKSLKTHSEQEPLFTMTEKCETKRVPLKEELFHTNLIGFNYGAHVEDWDFWFTEPEDRFARGISGHSFETHLWLVIFRGRGLSNRAVSSPTWMKIVYLDSEF